MSVQRILEIYIAPDCFGCETARNLASMILSLGHSDLEVRLQDLSKPNVFRPPAVFAVPTYLLDGRVISLGNPDQDWLLDQVAPPRHHQESLSDVHNVRDPTQAHRPDPPHGDTNRESRQHVEDGT